MAGIKKKCSVSQVPWDEQGAVDYSKMTGMDYIFMVGNQWKNIEYHNNARHYFTSPRWTVLQESRVPSFIDTSVLHQDIPLTCSVCFQV